MRRIVFAICTTITGLVLLLAYPTSLNRTTTTLGSGAAGAADAAATTTGTAGGTATTTGAAAAPATGTKTYTGKSVSTRYGNVQVEITVANGAITAAKAVDFPNGNGRDQQISSYAIPVLNSEAVGTKSAKISMVSGATFTSTGYLKSLQDAMDQAKL